MVTLSKYYRDVLVENKMNCEQILHPTSSCVYFHLKNLLPIIFGTAKFFFPLYFVSEKHCEE